MPLKIYRWLLAIIAVWVTMCIPTVTLPLVHARKEGVEVPVWAMLLPVGYALLPVSAFGLWNQRKWGFVMLVLATVAVAVSYPQGIQLHAMLILLAAIQYFTRDATTEQ